MQNKSESNISSIQNRARSIEVWEATCIVTNFSKAIVSPSRDDTNNRDGKYCSYLINPANPSLSGVSKFPYFRKGDPNRNHVPESFHQGERNHFSSDILVKLSHG